MAPVVELHESVVLLGRFPALTGISMSVSTGEVILIKGPNGAGKSTFLRLCAGLLPMKSGSGSILGFNLKTDRKAVRPHVGLMGHRNGLYPDLTIEENIQFWAKVSKAPSEQAARSLDLLGLTGRLATVLVRNLSEGQRRRVSLAALVVQRPTLWLLDEPHAALDKQGKELVDSLVGEAVIAGATVLLASHEIDSIGPIEPRVIEIAGGLVVRDSGGETSAS